MMRHRVRPAAQADIDEAAAYLAADRIEVGQQFLARVNQTIKEIATMPGLGAARDFANARVAGLRARRVIGFKNWLIFYRVTLEEIEIIRVLHGARDLDDIFAEED
jgi:toxin ParE1/3/4